MYTCYVKSSYRPGQEGNELTSSAELVGPEKGTAAREVGFTCGRGVRLLTSSLYLGLVEVKEHFHQAETFSARFFDRKTLKAMKRSRMPSPMRSQYA